MEKLTGNGKHTVRVGNHPGTESRELKDKK